MDVQLECLRYSVDASDLERADGVVAVLSDEAVRMRVMRLVFCDAGNDDNGCPQFVHIMNLIEVKNMK